MPDPTITGDGKTADDAALEAEEGARASAEAVNAEGELIGGKFKSNDEVLKAYENTQAEATRMAQELAELRKRADTAETQKGLVDAFKEAMAGTRGEAETAAELKAWKEALEGDDGADAVLELYRRATEDAKQSVSKVEQTLRDQLSALEKKVVESEARSDPAYVANRWKIDALAEKRGISRKEALEIFKDLMPSAASPTVPPGMEPGGGLAAAGGRVDRKVDPRAGWTNQEREWDEKWGATAMERAEGASK